MSDEQQTQTPPVDESKIQELAEQRANEIAREKYKDYLSPRDVEGLVSKRDELLEKTAKFKNVSIEQLEQFQRDQERLQKDEVYKLISEGKHDEALEKLYGPQKEAWKEKLSGIEEQLSATQSTIEQERQDKQDIATRYQNLQKKTYLKDISGEDESFRSEYFSEFYELHKDKIEFDEETGAVYALRDGKRIVDAEGNHVKFEKQYAKIKAENGLFWKGGQGTNTRGGKGGELDKPFSKMTMAEKSELRKSVGDDEYRKIVLSASSKK